MLLTLHLGVFPVVLEIFILNTSYYSLVGLSETRGSAYYELDLPKINNHNKNNITPVNYE